VVLGGTIDVARAYGSLGVMSGKDLAWSRGLGLELSTIKTRYSSKKSGTSLSFSANQLSTTIDQGVLKGIKSLAREKSGYFYLLTLEG